MVDMTKPEEAAQALKEGKFILVYDGDEREGEADLMIHAKFVTPKAVERLRRDAGGLICLAIGGEEAEKLGLPFMTDVMRRAGLERISCKKTAYGDEPAFSLAINHKKVYTGIPDNDRSLTITEFEKTLHSSEPKKAFETDFYAPGHVFLLISRGLEKRRGHTELGVKLAQLSGLGGCIVMCEMLGSGRAKNKAEAQAYAKENGLTFIVGGEI